MNIERFIEISLESQLNLKYLQMHKYIFAINLL